MSGSSSIVDEDTARAVNTGRETIGVMLRTAQQRLQVVFIAFVVGLFAGIVAMRSYIWPQFKQDLRAEGVDIIFQTPFDVILLQVKIGLIVGVIAAVPVLLYYAREPMVRRGIIPDIRVTKWHVAAATLIALGLGAVGVAYSYLLFFPIMFQFLANNAMGAGLAPRYSIVMWTQFILVLSFSFAVAAQLPLVMSALSYTEIVPYETFRDKWKYAVVAIFTFGALFSPPDPFTQIMWAMPLLLLYGFSLYLAKIVTTMRRGSERLNFGAVLRDRWNYLAGAGVLGVALGYAVFTYGGVALVNRALVAVGSSYRLPAIEDALGLPRGTAVLVGAAVFGLLGLVAGSLYVIYIEIEAAASAEAAVYSGRAPSTENLNLEILDAEGVRAAPDDRFDAMDEEEALALANDAMEDGDDEKAQAILDRFDEAQERAEAEGEGEEAEAEAGEGESENVVTSTTAGMLDAFTEEETTEEDIGGYYHDIAYVLNSLRARTYVIVGWFMTVLAVTFAFLYRGGLGAIRDDFLARIPETVRPENLAANWPITLHPVEALVFEVKVSTVVAAIAVFPMLVYYAWPALSERGIVTGDRRTIVVWAGGLFVGLVGGSALGYFYVAPTVISYLVVDAVRANMIISYRVSDFLWLVFLTTGGIGLLADIPITMLLFHFGDIVDYQTMRDRWRVVVLAGFAFGALVTPESMYTMLIVALPIALFYFVGLGLLWVATLGGRRGGGGGTRSERPA